MPNLVHRSDPYSMTVVQDSTTVVPGVPGRGWVALGVGMVAVLSFVLFLGVPYYVNDLHQYSLAETSGGGHDPKDLWPLAADGPLAFGFSLGGALTVTLGPVLLIGAGIWALVMAIAEWRALDNAGRGVRLATVALAALWLSSPFVQALTTWYTD